MVVLDTDHCVFFLRGEPSVLAAFHAHAGEPPAVSIVTAGELYFGALRSSRPTRNLGLCEAFLDRLFVLGLTREIVRRFAQVKADLYGRGERIEDPDILIAATALTHDATLVTQNQRHFERIGGLRMQCWVH